MKLRTKDAGSSVRIMPPNTSDDTTVNTNYTTIVDNEGLMTIPKQILESLDWHPGDELQWDINDSVITLTKLND
jgi:hypothetical protein